ncbi:MAG: protein phosphatase 2C domain-containing protein [Planctomycetia bacterium]|nr:protein phosphatase 2C domain-containing protein [Planctomycetia bacterium]
MNEKSNWWDHMIRFSARTDIGMRRSNNQDSHSVSPANSSRLWRTRGHLFIVADGMGAHAAGERASRMATDIISQSYIKRTSEITSDALRNAVIQAHQQIKREGASDEAFHDMGTTVDALLLLPEGAYVAHVGDSRVYRLRNRSFEQLTFDHSLVWEVRHSGRVPMAKVPAFIPKNVITRSLGPTDNLVVDLEGPFPLQPGDSFLLCSDGLTGQVDDTEIGQIIELFPPNEATEALINLANLRGGPDNITIIVVQVLSLPEPEEDKRDTIYEKRIPISTLSWSLMALTIAALLTLLITAVVASGNEEIRSGCFKGSIISGLVAFVFASLFLWSARKSLFRFSNSRSSSKILGKGPYIRTPVAPSSSFCDKLNEIVNQLIIAVQNQGISLNWKNIEKQKNHAFSCLKVYNYEESIRSYIRIINLLMKELKKKTSTNKNQKP